MKELTEEQKKGIEEIYAKLNELGLNNLVLVEVIGTPIPPKKP